MKPQKYRQDEDFKLPEVLMPLNKNYPFTVDESYFLRNEDLWLAEATIKSMAAPEKMPFVIEKNYFEEFHSRLQTVSSQQEKPKAIFKLWEWSYAAAAVLAVLLTVYPFVKSTDIQQQPVQQPVSDEELITYIHENISLLNEEDLSEHVDYTYQLNQINIEDLLEEHPDLLYNISPDDIQSL